MVDFIIIFITLLAGQGLCNYYEVRSGNSFILGFVLACLLVSVRYCLGK